MAQEDNSFNSTGATVVAFETLNTEGFASFGVSVSSTTCGVYGRTLDQPLDPGHDGRTAPSNTGVFGRSDVHGVYGITNRISDADTPDFTNVADTFSNITAPGIGVIGVSSSIGVASGSPAILANNGLIGVDFTNSIALAEMIFQQIGMASITLRGAGVFGLSLGNDPRANPGVQEIARQDLLDGSNIADTGVTGVSVAGAGVRAVSMNDRGGVFESARAGGPIIAQIRLIPSQKTNSPAGADPVAPTDKGEAGDLLALTYVDANQRRRAALFFCIEGVSTLGSAFWKRLA